MGYSAEDIGFIVLISIVGFVGSIACICCIASVCCDGVFMGGDLQRYKQCPVLSTERHGVIAVDMTTPA